MTSMGIVFLPLLLYVVEAKPQYQYQPERTGDRSGIDWNKRPFPSTEDYYGFLTDEQKRSGLHPSQKYMDFLLGDKRTPEKKNNDAYWDFIGAKAKKTNTRKRRSNDGLGHQVNQPSSLTGDGSQQQRQAAGSQRRIDPRSAGRDGFENWDDFVLGKRVSTRRENVNFDDFLLGDKRSPSDYDYAEFVLGKRP